MNLERLDFACFVQVAEVFLLSKLSVLYQVIVLVFEERMDKRYLYLTKKWLSPGFVVFDVILPLDCKSGKERSVLKEHLVHNVTKFVCDTEVVALLVYQLFKNNTVNSESFKIVAIVRANMNESNTTKDFERLEVGLSSWKSCSGVFVCKVRGGHSVNEVSGCVNHRIIS